MSLQKEQFNELVEDVFRQEYMRIVNPKKCSDLELKAYLEKHLYFVTMTFKMAFTSNHQNAQRCMDSFREMYLRLIESLLGSHYSRKLPIQPLTFYCVDNENSRHGMVDLVNGRNLHVHALMFLHPQTMKSWELIDHNKLRTSDSTIDRLSFSPYEPARGSVKNLASYVSKATRITDQGIHWDFLPKNLNKKISAMENRNTPYAVITNSSATLANGSQLHFESGMKRTDCQNDFTLYVQNARKMHYRKLEQKALRSRIKKIY